jgi:hypothetical protein
MTRTTLPDFTLSQRRWLAAHAATERAQAHLDRDELREARLALEAAKMHRDDARSLEALGR